MREPQRWIELRVGIVGAPVDDLILRGTWTLYPDPIHLLLRRGGRRRRDRTRSSWACSLFMTVSEWIHRRDRRGIDGQAVQFDATAQPARGRRASPRSRRGTARDWSRCTTLVLDDILCRFGQARHVLTALGTIPRPDPVLGGRPHGPTAGTRGWQRQSVVGHP